MTSKLRFLDRQCIAYSLYDAGFPPSYSHDQAGFTTSGYGALDDSGNWEYPLVIGEYGYNSLEIVPWWLMGPIIKMEMKNETR